MITEEVDYRKWILRSIRARANIRREDEGDLLNEVLLRAADAFTRGRVPAPELTGPWLSRIARYALADYRRRQSREAWGLNDPVHVPIAFEKSPENQVIDDDILKRVQAAIAELPPHLSESFRLVIIESVPPTEVCRKLRCGRTKLWENVSEAKKQLHFPLSKAFIEGKVVNAAEKIEKTARVELRGPLLRSRARSGGTFCFEWLQPATYRLTVVGLECGDSSAEIDAHPGANRLVIRVQKGTPKDR